MLFQDAQPDKFHVAVLSLIRLLSIVPSLVICQVSLSGERFVTAVIVAKIWLLT